jgi:hypothetical protein
MHGQEPPLNAGFFRLGVRRQSGHERISVLIFRPGTFLIEVLPSRFFQPYANRKLPVLPILGNRAE